MFGVATQQKISELERADTLSQVRFWARVFEQPSFEPQIRRISVDEFYESVMPIFTKWLRAQMILAAVTALVIVAAVFSFKVADDHIKYQDAIIEYQTSLLENALQNPGQAKWLVAQRTRFVDESINIDTCGTCTDYGVGLDEYRFLSNEYLDLIEAAARGKNRFTNSLMAKSVMALVGAFAGYLLLRNLFRMRAVIRATRRLNDALLATDPSFRAFTRK